MGAESGPPLRCLGQSQRGTRSRRKGEKKTAYPAGEGGISGRQLGRLFTPLHRRVGPAGVGPGRGGRAAIPFAAGSPVAAVSRVLRVALVHAKASLSRLNLQTKCKALSSPKPSAAFQKSAQAYEKRRIHLTNKTVRLLAPHRALMVTTFSCSSPASVSRGHPTTHSSRTSRR